MRFGYFDNEKKEYVITNPDTPQPWSNYLGSPQYGAIITNNAGGYSFVKSGAGGRILRWYFNALMGTEPGRYLYIHDRDSKEYWSASWAPVCKPLDRYSSQCRHGTGYTVITSAYEGIDTETVYYVPLGATHEVWSCSITNRGVHPRNLAVFSYAELTNHDLAAQDMENFQYSRYISRTCYDDNVLFQIINEYQGEIGRVTGKPGMGMYRFVGIAGAPVVSYDGSRESFIGMNRGYACPCAVERGTCAGSLNYTENSSGALQVDLELAPGETRRIIVVLGPGDRDKARAVMRLYSRETLVDDEIDELKSFWHARLERFQVKTPDKNFDTMVNIWNAYQCYITFTWSREASLVYGGERYGYGYRDTVQDIQAIMHLEPGLARERIVLMLSGQLSCGGAIPVVPYTHLPGSVEPERFARGFRCDDTMWLFQVVDMYVMETGDAAFLDTVVGYADTGEDSVMRHLRAALDFSRARLGEHGLVLGLEADWNDCLHLGEKGESTFASFQLYLAFSIYAGLARLRGLDADAAWAVREAATLLDNIQKHAWEGDRFVRAFSSIDGYVVGSGNNDEGSLFFNPQAWAVISGAASREQGCTAMDTVRENLYTEYGVMLCAPAFRKYGLPVVRAILFPAGVKENAGIFSHTQGWAVLAEALLGRGNRAWEYYAAANPAAMNDRAGVRETEPYVHCQFTEGKESPFSGRAHNPWLTGSATTFQTAAVRGILGIRPELEGLRIDPSIPAAWDSLVIRRHFRGKTLDITVRNPRHVEHGVEKVVLNGETMTGALIPESKMKEENSVEVILG